MTNLPIPPTQVNKKNEIAEKLFEDSCYNKDLSLHIFDNAAVDTFIYDAPFVANSKLEDFLLFCLLAKERINRITKDLDDTIKNLSAFDPQSYAVMHFLPEFEELLEDKDGLFDGSDCFWLLEPALCLATSGDTSALERCVEATKAYKTISCEEYFEDHETIKEAFYEHLENYVKNGGELKTYQQIKGESK